MILDTSALLSALVGDEVAHADVVEALTAGSPPYVISPFVLAELDHLVATRGGVAAELAMLRELSRPPYEIASFAGADVAQASEIVAAYRDQWIGLADASIVVLADRYRTDRVLTLDERHFRVLRTLDGRPFTVLPADS